ncbi:loricrin-like [Ceratina calcarata]|uniref:Loricrin-like n=1 Tax=Ceratina calcarata TaxID=156304 RepID=A0AAJ7WB87_9HYME|nr:loricrin-like [Ceratina calcarata]
MKHLSRNGRATFILQIVDIVTRKRQRRNHTNAHVYENRETDNEHKELHDPVTQTPRCKAAALQKIHDCPFRLTGMQIVTSLQREGSRGGSRCTNGTKSGRGFLCDGSGHESWIGVTKTNWKGGDRRRKARAIKEAPDRTMGIKHLNMKVFAITILLAFVASAYAGYISSGWSGGGGGWSGGGGGWSGGGGGWAGGGGGGGGKIIKVITVSGGGGGWPSGGGGGGWW